jgi:hypothetical protein
MFHGVLADATRHRLTKKQLSAKKQSLAKDFQVYKIRRPWISLTRMIMMAMTRRMWMNPPTVELVTIPRSQRTIKTIAMVNNMSLSLSWFEGG